MSPSLIQSYLYKLSSRKEIWTTFWTKSKSPCRVKEITTRSGSNGTCGVHSALLCLLPVFAPPVPRVVLKKHSLTCLLACGLGLWSSQSMLTCWVPNCNIFIYQRPILQSLCFIIYCSAPIGALAFLVFIMNMVIGSFFVNLIIAVCALLFTLRSNEAYFRSLVTGERQMLNLYPVLLFYVFICLFIAMIWVRK